MTQLSITQQMFHVTVRMAVETAAGRRTGTGYWIAVRDADGMSHRILVTNKHVLDGATAVTFTMAKGKQGIPLPEPATLRLNGITDQHWFGHPDPRVDVAVMYGALITDAMQRNGIDAFTAYIGEDLVLSSKNAGRLDAIEDVLFIGYPNGLYDTHNTLPIARKGMTATPINSDYRGTPTFLIDASIFGGSSGSPVFIFDRHARTSGVGGIAITGESRLLHLGVVAAVHTRQVSGAVMELPASSVAVFDEGLDLGLVYKASTVLEAADGLLAKLGRTPADRSVAVSSSAGLPTAQRPTPN
ncbi:trypsin-like peptidase domain-containing protein [Microbacterium sp. E-13]|uniref:trypsin-like peptidase domain-containing protein n=1 Tax=Microbacterium sp. E-13 TaxID=3404048 RepID=UPI003CF1E3C3